MKKQSKLNEENNRKIELENLIKDISDSNLSLRSSDDLPDRDVELTDYDSIKTESDLEAEKIINNIVNFYFKDINLNIENNITKILKDKMKIDILSISQIIFQLKTNEIIIIKLLKEIDLGANVARLYDSLSKMQNSKLDTIKYLNQQVFLLESQYKSIAENNFNNQNDSNDFISINDTTNTEIENKENKNDTINTIKIRGTKELIKMIRNQLDGDHEINKENNN